MADITDGTSNTYLCAEKFLDPNAYTTGYRLRRRAEHVHGLPGRHRALGWQLGADASYAPRQDQTNQNNVLIFGSAHPSGFNAAMCDGSVKPVSYAIHLQTHRCLGNRKDGQTIDGGKL